MSAIVDLLAYDFFQRALLAALLVAVLASVLGVPIVLRGLAMFGHGFAHVAFAGVALGFAAGLYPLGMALAFTIVGALLIQWLWTRGILSGDTGLGMISSVGFAIGVVVVSYRGGFTTDLNSYLFGNLLAVTRADVLLMLPVGLGLLGLFTLLYKELFYVTFSEHGARISGLPVDGLNALFMALTAATIVLASRVVGLLLVAALLVIPAASALQVARSFRGAVILSAGAGAASVLLGVLAAVELDIATGGAVVLASAGVFLAALVAGRIQNL